MAVDRAGKDWQRIAKELAAELPGSWKVGGTGIRTVVAREPIRWTLVWFGTDRVRRDDVPCLIGGDATLVGPPFNLGVGHGLRSDVRRNAPKRVDPSAPDALELTRAFVVDDLLPQVDPWTEDRLADEAEVQLALPMKERGRPLRFQDAAGWRVLRGEPGADDPAQQAVDWYGYADAPDVADWYRVFLEKWGDGADRARDYLETERAAAIARLKLG